MRRNSSFFVGDVAEMANVRRWNAADLLAARSEAGIFIRGDIAPPLFRPTSG